MNQLQQRVMEWAVERERLRLALAKGTDEQGWPLSPEAKTMLRQDIAEVTRTLRRLGAKS